MAYGSVNVPGIMKETATTNQDGLMSKEDKTALDQAIQNIAAVETQLKGMSVQLYVSLSGSDETGDGTQDKPYRTVQKAVDAIKPYHTNASIILETGGYDDELPLESKKKIQALLAQGCVAGEIIEIEEGEDDYIPQF